MKGRLVPVARHSKPAVDHFLKLRISAADLECVETTDNLPHQIAHFVLIRP